MTAAQEGDLRQLVPFPATTTSPAEQTGEVALAGPVLDGELLTDEQYRRARRLAEFARSRLPARWRTAIHRQPACWMPVAFINRSATYSHCLSLRIGSSPCRRTGQCQT